MTTSWNTGRLPGEMTDRAARPRRETYDAYCSFGRHDVRIPFAPDPKREFTCRDCRPQFEAQRRDERIQRLRAVLASKQEQWDRLEDVFNRKRANISRWQERMRSLTSDRRPPQWWFDLNNRVDETSYELQEIAQKQQRLEESIADLRGKLAALGDE